MFRPCINPNTGLVELKNLETDNLENSIIVKTSIEANQGSMSIDGEGIQQESKTRKSALELSKKEEEMAIENAISKNPNIKK